MAGEPLENDGGPAAGEGAGDSAAADAATPETPGGDGAGGEDSAAVAAQERDRYIAEVASRAAMEVVQRLLSEGQNGQQAPATGTPPTPGTSDMDRLESERQRIIADQQKLEQDIAREGITGELILRSNELTSRKAEFIGKVNLLAIKQQESERAAATKGQEPEWLAMCKQNPNVPLDILRDAYEKRHAAAAGAAALAGQLKKPSAKPSPVDVSGAGERGTPPAKTPTISTSQFQERKAQLRAEGKHDEAAKLDRDVRSRNLLLKD